MNASANPEFHIGIRDDKFRIFIGHLLKFGHVNQDTLNKLMLQPRCIKLFEQAFTHASIPGDDYEYLEFLGDATVNKAIPWYLTRRYPRLCQSDGVKILARLKINLVSSKVFAHFGRLLKFERFISSSVAARQQGMDKILEDVFEAFFGATELALDHLCGMNTGYNTCYHLIANLLRDYPISLRYTDLFDAKTRLKELLDAHRNELGALEYRTERAPNNQWYCQIYRLHSTSRMLLVEASADTRSDAEQAAATQGIQRLKVDGYSKAVPQFYGDIEREYHPVNAPAVPSVGK